MMNLTWNWVAIALSLTAAAPTAGNPGVVELKTAVVKLRQVSVEARNPGRITYEVRVAEAEGLGWREACFKSLTPIARRGTATIWTAPDRVIGTILHNAKILEAPKLTVAAQTAAHFTSRTNRSLVTRVSWSGDDPSAVSEAIREGYTATIVGRRLDQGVLVQVVIDDTEIRGVHTVKLAQASGAQASCREACEKDATPGKSTASTCCDESKAGEVAGLTLQVPEVASQEVLGEWLIPYDGALIVGFGVHTAADADGKAVVRERLMLIRTADYEVKQTALREPGQANRPSPSTIPAPVTPSPSTIPAPVAPSPSNNPIPTPAIPSRTLPQGVHADGSPAELPPLPEDVETPEADESAEPHGSPQNRPKGQAIPMPKVPKPDTPEKTVDTRSTKAGFILGTKLDPTFICPVMGKAASTPFSVHARETKLAPYALPASLDRWIESVRAKGLLMQECTDSDESACSEQSDCLDCETKD